MKRCTETARKALCEIVGKGVKIQIMPALAGREGSQSWDKENEGDEMEDSWVMEHVGPRDRRTKDSEYVLRYLTLEGLNAGEAQEVKEVVIVTQGRLLMSLLGNSKSDHASRTVSSFRCIVDTRQ